MRLHFTYKRTKIRYGCHLFKKISSKIDPKQTLFSFFFERRIHNFFRFNLLIRAKLIEKNSSFASPLFTFTESISLSLPLSFFFSMSFLRVCTKDRVILQKSRFTLYNLLASYLEPMSQTSEIKQSNWL